jgi:hypothetical protein
VRGVGIKGANTRAYVSETGYLNSRISIPTNRTVWFDEESGASCLTYLQRAHALRSEISTHERENRLDCHGIRDDLSAEPRRSRTLSTF